MKKNKKPIIFVVLSIFLFIIGGTIAYYTSSDTFENEFSTAGYKIEVMEVFTSPTDWTPGTTTPKEVSVTNKSSDKVAVRIKIEESWKDENGNPIDPYDENYESAAIVNFAPDARYYWNPVGDPYGTSVYMYYYKSLDPNESTSNFMESVTFNPYVEISENKNCTTNEETHATTCTTETTGFGGGTYTLEVVVETCQYDHYKEIWNTNVEILDSERVYERMLKNDYHDVSSEEEFYGITFGKEISRGSFESVTTVNSKTVPEDAIDSWDASEKSDGSVMAWYKDADNDNKYELYIGADDGVRANMYSMYAFGYFDNAERVDLTYLDSSDVTMAVGMFYAVGASSRTSLEIVGLEDLDVSKVLYMDGMFMWTGGRGRTYDLSNWDISQLISAQSALFQAKFTTTGITWPSEVYNSPY